MNYLLLIIGAVPVAAVSAYLLRKRKTVAAVVARLLWIRAIEIEICAWVRKRYRTTVPAGAQNVESIGGWHTVFEWQTQPGRPSVWVPVQKYRKYFDYDIYEPVSTRRVVGSGTRREGVSWPAFTLAANEREKDGGRSEEYRVEFGGDDGKQYRKSLDRAEWSDVCEEGRYRLFVTVWGSVARYERVATPDLDLI